MDLGAAFRSCRQCVRAKPVAMLCIDCACSLAPRMQTNGRHNKSVVIVASPDSALSPLRAAEDASRMRSCGATLRSALPQDSNFIAACPRQPQMRHKHGVHSADRRPHATRHDDQEQHQRPGRATPLVIASIDARTSERVSKSDTKARACFLTAVRC